MRFLVRLLVTAVAMGLTFLLVDLCWDGQILPLIIIALIFGLVNALIRPLLLILTCPLII
jgi:putative membrane protein